LVALKYSNFTKAKNIGKRKEKKTLVFKRSRENKMNN
jgi:hypothetical protein